MNKKHRYHIFALMAVLCLGATTDGYRDQQNTRHRKAAKKEAVLKECLDEYVAEHFPKKTARVYAVKHPQKTSIRSILTLKRDGWQHFICDDSRGDLCIVNGLCAKNKPGCLYPRIDFDGGLSVYATEKGPGQAGKYLIGKNHNAPTGQNEISRLEHTKDGKTIAIQYTIVDKIGGTNLIISDDKNQEIGRLKLKKVDSDDWNDDDWNDDGWNDEGWNDKRKKDRSGKTRLKGKTKVELDDVVENIEDIKKKDKSWKKNTRLIKRFVKDTLLHPNVSNEPPKKLSEKTKEELEKISKNIRVYMSNNPDWDAHLDFIVKILEKAIVD
jgi:hypothetical protein